ncbi:DhnA family fructose-bisphosphate aldolase class Ia [Paenibacillus shirakamiensis]|uniref:DhnA family fructose-bisphosphate aldolase class Ia n=1 Tax=Paenibacillus shirakamiensis TaxID=1265935 RepID=A0ABS4JDY6_9BACL|nr:hypothetical protein [Paenibacillus shirakamiensis]MBP1999937.1 DhnA family fructose-bisphosphate aldolase class Ia [Paenibacillus shirakamiensis]
MNNINNVAGQWIRLRRILNPHTGRSLIIPLDHAITSGPVKGLTHPSKIVTMAAQSGADAVMLRPGLIHAVAETDSKNLGIILALTGRFDRGIDHVLLNSVEHALRYGADAICTEFKFGSDGDLENAKMASEITERAHQYNLPVLMTIYAIPGQVQRLGEGAYAHACRIGEELGADMVKIYLPNDEEVIQSCLDAVSVPLIMAGGSKSNTDEFYDHVETAIQLGVAGAAIGRNIWEHDNSSEIASKLAAIIHERNPKLEQEQLYI